MELFRFEQKILFGVDSLSLLTSNLRRSKGSKCSPDILELIYYIYFIMPPTLKKLMGHIAFGACVGGCVRGWVTLFVPTVTFKPLKLES